MAAIQEDRGPSDYPPWDDERRILINIIRKQTESAGGNYTEGGGGDRTLLKWVLGVLSLLTASAVIGGVTIYGKVSSIETGLLAHEQRIDRLERASERR
jgi:hypothetical protein